MEIAKIIQSYIAVLIWPAVTWLIFSYFKDEIKILITKITKASLPGGIELDINQTIRESKELIPEAIKERKIKEKSKRTKAPLKIKELNEIHAKYGLKETTSKLNIEFFKKIAKIDPILAVASIRIDLEILVKNLAKRYNLSPNEGKSAQKLTEILLDNHKITYNQFTRINKLLKICNAGIHGEEINESQIDEIVSIAKILVDDYKSWLIWGFSNKQ